MKRLKSGSAWLLAVLFIVSVTVGLMVFSRGDDSRAPQAAALTTTPTLPPYPIGTPTPWLTLVVPETPTDTPIGAPTYRPTSTATSTRVPTLTPTSTPIGTPTQIDTQTWKTYDNSDYGFRIKYPQSFTYALGVGYPDKDRLFHIGFFDAGYKPSDPNFRAIALTVIANPKRLDIDAFINENVDTGSQPPKIVAGEPFISPTDRREVQISGIRSIRFIHYPLGMKVPVVLMPTPGNTRVIMVAYNFHPVLEPIFEAMIQTLEIPR